MRTRLDLKPSSLAVLKVLAKHHPNPAPLKLEDIASASGLCVRTCKTHVKHLSTIGLIYPSRPATDRPYSYKVRTEAFLVLGYHQERNERAS